MFDRQPEGTPAGDAAVTRTEKLRELRQEISKVVQHIGAAQLEWESFCCISWGILWIPSGKLT